MEEEVDIPAPGPVWSRKEEEWRRRGGRRWRRTTTASSATTDPTGRYWKHFRGRTGGYPGPGTGMVAKGGGMAPSRWEEVAEDYDRIFRNDRPYWQVLETL